MAKTICIGDLVTVGPAYRGHGRYVPDEFCGRWYVVGIVPGYSGQGPHDYKLAHHPEDDWAVIIHETRLSVT